MNLAYSFENPVNHFKAIGDVTLQDLRVIRAALFRFFESSPKFVVLDFSTAKKLNEIQSTELNQVLSEIKSFANASKVNFDVVYSIEESFEVSTNILEKALEEMASVLQSKNSVKEELKFKVKALLKENEALKEKLEAIPTMEDTGSLTSLLDRFWSASK